MHSSDLDPHLTHGSSLDPRVSPSPTQNGISIGSAVFAQLTGVPNTQTGTQSDTQTQTTLRATSAAIGRIYALLPLRAGDAA